MFGVVPAEQISTNVTSVLDRTEPLGELGTVFERLELTLRVRIVVGNLGAAVGLRQLLFFTLNREDFSFVIHLDRQPRTSRRREAQTGSRGA